MSKVMPKKPGYWWQRGDKGDGPIEFTVFVYRDSNRMMYFTPKGSQLPVDPLPKHIEWIAPVPTAEAVQAAVEAMMNACRKMEDAGWHPCEGEELSNAIAGLTGEGE